MSDETTLLPCPFCGGEAKIIESDYGMYLTGYAVYCKGECHAKLGVSGRLGEAYEWTPYFDTEAEAIAAWNTRADYHGYEQAAIEAWENIKAWNTRAERTCECVAEYAKSPIDGKTIVLHRCSACHELMRPHMAYCPNCGAKVVGE